MKTPNPTHHWLLLLRGMFPLVLLMGFLTATPWAFGQNSNLWRGYNIGNTVARAASHEAAIDALDVEINNLRRDLSERIDSANTARGVETGMLQARLQNIEDKVSKLPKEPGLTAAALEPIQTAMKALQDDIKKLQSHQHPKEPSVTPAPDTTPPPEVKSRPPAVPVTPAVPDAAAPKVGKDKTLSELTAMPSVSGADLARFQISMNIIWTLVAGFLVMFMQAGFALVETGFVCKKNAVHTMGMNFMVYSLAMLGYWACGFAFQMGGVGAEVDASKVIHPLGAAVYETLRSEYSINGYGLIGTQGFFLSDPRLINGSVLTLFLFGMVFMDTAATIPTGAMAERWKFGHFCLYGFAAGAVIYPVYANWVWGGGWLSSLGQKWHLGQGVVDFAGSSVVHLCGGTMAYVGARKLGPRQNRYTANGTLADMPKHNTTLGVLGAFILAFGWFGFNAGSTMAVTAHAGVIATNTMLSSAAGAVTMLLLTYLTGKPMILYMCNGMLGGLVAITASCAFVSPGAAVLIGVIAALFVIAAVKLIEDSWRLIDDPVGAVSVHGACGLWGMLAVGIFANGQFGKDVNSSSEGCVRGVLAGDWSQLVAQIVGIIACIGITWLLTNAVLWLIEMLAGSHRSNAQDELDGLDKADFDTEAYDNRDTP